MENIDTEYVNTKYEDLDHDLTKVSFNIIYCCLKLETKSLRSYNNKKTGFQVST